MPNQTDNYREHLRTLTNRQLITEAGNAVHASTVEHNDDKATACYAEAKARGNTDLYKRGFARSQGHDSLNPALTSIDVGEPS